MSNVRTYKVTHFATHVKLAKVAKVLAEYRMCCTDIARRQWRLFLYGEKLCKNEELWYIYSRLSERYKRNCAFQVDGQIKSYLSNRQNEFKEKVYNSSIGEELRKKLFQINKRELWYAKEHPLFKKEELWLARKIFKRLLDTNRKPNFRKNNMLLNDNVAKLIQADKKRTIGFDYWIQVSTLESGKPIMIPILSNDYFNSIDGKLLHAAQFNFDKKGELTIALMKDIPKKVIEFKTEEINLDWGLKALFTNSDGNMFGKGVYAILLKYDKIISELASNLQKQKIKLTDSARYNNLIRKVRAYIKNEINRVINHMVKLYRPKKITVEDLNLKDSTLSKRLNRIIRNCGRSVINEKFESLEKIQGIKIVPINAAYTSQECSNCHYVDKKNRKTQEVFECKHCRLTIHADVSGARVNRYRSSIPELANVHLSRKTILRKIVTLFMERNPRLNSKAKRLLCENPYFKDVVRELKWVA